MVKQREGRRLVSVTRRVVYGNPRKIDPRQISTSLKERLNLTLRQENASLTRKTLAFGKEEEEMCAQLACSSPTTISFARTVVYAAG